MGTGLFRCGCVVVGDLWCVDQCEAANICAGSKTGISRERLAARGRPAARCRAAGQGHAVAATERPRAAYLRRYAQNTEARPHGHFEGIAVTRTWLLGRALDATTYLWAASGGRVLHCAWCARRRRCGGSGGKRGRKSAAKRSAAVCRDINSKIREISAAMCGARAGCAASVA